MGPVWGMVIVRSGASGGPLGRIVVGSVAVLLFGFVSPPPDTITVLTTLGGASAAIRTVSCAVELSPGSIGVVRVQPICALHFHSGGTMIDSGVSPVGNVSFTWIAPTVAAPPTLVTVIV